MDEDDDFTPWTPQTAARLKQVAAEVADAVVAHARLIAGMTGARAETVELFAASEVLARKAVEYADAQFAHTGSGFPFGVIEQYLGDDEDDVDDAEGGPVAGISVLRRQDYALTDEGAVLAAGREAYLASWPDDDDADAAADVDHLGRALYQVAHAHGWDALGDTPGLEPTGAVTVVVPRDDVLRGDGDDWPDDPFTDPGHHLYRQDDIWAGP